MALPANFCSSRETGHSRCCDKEAGFAPKPTLLIGFTLGEMTPDMHRGSAAAQLVFAAVAQV